MGLGGADARIALQRGEYGIQRAFFPNAHELGASAEQWDRLAADTVQAIRAGERPAKGLRLILIEQDQNLPGHRRGQQLAWGHTLAAVRD